MGKVAPLTLVGALIAAVLISCAAGQDAGQTAAQNTTKPGIAQADSSDSAAPAPQESAQAAGTAETAALKQARAIKGVETADRNLPSARKEDSAVASQAAAKQEDKIPAAAAPAGTAPASSGADASSVPMPQHTTATAAPATPAASTAAAGGKPTQQQSQSAAVSADSQPAPANVDSAPTSAPTSSTPAAVPANSKPAAAAEAASSTSTGSSDATAAAPSSVSQIVQVAPGAVLETNNDINPEGACKAFIAAQCEGVQFADGQVAECLAEYQRGVEAEAGDGDVGAEGLSDECNEEVMQFKINTNTNINSNIPLARACAADANKYCNMTWYNGYRNGSVIACLRDIRDKLKPECQKQVFKVQLDASYDYRADQILHEACHKDAETWCPGVKLGSGRMQDCLKKHRLKLSWDCNGQLFRKEVEDTDDIRLSMRLFRACLADKKQFCADVAPGQAMAKQCLEEHLDQLSSDCRSEMESMIEQRVRNFRLDSRLRRACEGEIYDTCAYLGDVDTLSDYDSVVINCLQDFSSEIKSQACQMQVHKYVELAAQDIRFDVPLADACYEDRMKLCASVPPGSARVIRCLQSQRDKLSVVCRATLMSEEMRFSENIDFQYPMKQACLKEIDMFCHDVPHGNARVIRCLQLKKGDKNFGKACRVEVERYEQESAKDYRLNFRLYDACKADVGQICKDACKLQDGEICGGKVLSCLSDSKASIKNEACRKEVTYLEKLEVNDFRTDMVLAEACRPDVAKFCSKVEPGEGRVHTCLRDNAAQLSQACRKEEMHLEEKEAETVQMSANLLQTCAAERSLFCRGVAPGSARVFRCLAGNMASADFGGSCKDMILNKLKRRDANWRLDPPLRKACKGDVDRLCVQQDAQNSDNAAVKKCMISKQAELSPGCQRELGRSLHMSFFVWQPKGVMTAPCDADIQKLCLSQTPGLEVAPGAVSVCLAEIVDKMSQSEPANRRKLLTDGGSQPAEKKDKDAKSLQQQQGRKEQPGRADKPPAAASAARKGAGAAAAAVQSNQQQEHHARSLPELSEQCYQLAVLAEPPKVQQSYDVKTLAYSALQSSLEKVEQTTGLQTLSRDRQGGVRSVSLTGWTAVVGMAALVVLMLAGATIAVRQYIGQGSKDGYTLVMKQTPSS